MRARYESVTLGLTTREGFPMAVGGICQEGTGNRWSQRFEMLAALEFTGGDLYTIDYVIARAIQEIADPTLLIAGCCVDTGADLRQGESTGGVLGSPRQSIQSANEDCETLPEGFSMYTAPGGPGLAALAGEDAICRAVLAIKALGSTPSKEDVLEQLHTQHIDTFLLVLDGSGPGATGCLAAGSGGRADVLFLHKD